MPNDAWSELDSQMEKAREADTASKALPHLREAKNLIDTLLNERMAEALVEEGVSIRSAASMAGFSENAVGPRLARSSLLASYARDDGRITVAEVHHAQYDRKNQHEPMRFVPRQSR